MVRREEKKRGRVRLGTEEVGELRKMPRGVKRKKKTRDKVRKGSLN